MYYSNLSFINLFSHLTLCLCAFRLNVQPQLSFQGSVKHHIFCYITQSCNVFFFFNIISNYLGSSSLMYLHSNYNYDGNGGDDFRGL